MGYHTRHTIYLKQHNEEKLTYLNELLERQGLEFVVAEGTVFDHNGEPEVFNCISDSNWNFGDGYIWYDFVSDMESVMEEFNKKYPSEEVHIYIHTEDDYEAICTFKYGYQMREDKIYHYREELEKVCKTLKDRHLQLYKTHIIANHPLVLHHDGAYVMIGFNVFELYREWASQNLTPNAPEFGSGHWNYNNLEFKAKAMTVLSDFLVNLRLNGKIMKYA